MLKKYLLLIKLTDHIPTYDRHVSKMWTKGRKKKGLEEFPA